MVALLTVWIEVIAGLSLLGSISVMLTLMLFPEMRSKSFMRMIAYVLLCDFLANFPYVLPHRPKSGPWCVLQGLLNITFYPASWLWTLLVMYLLYFVALHNEFPSTAQQRSLKAACWLLPASLTALSLTCTRYGHSTFEDYSFEVCIFAAERDALVFHAVSYYGLLVVVLAALLYMHYALRRLEQDRSRQLSPMYEVARHSLRLHGPALALCWVPHCVLFFVGLIVDNDGVGRDSRAMTGFYFLTEALKLLHGLAAAVVFFYKSPESRRLWGKLLARSCPCLFGAYKPSERRSSTMDDVPNPSLATRLEWDTERDTQRERDGRVSCIVMSDLHRNRDEDI